MVNPRKQKMGWILHLCMIDKEKDIVQFAGAFNPLYLIRNGELQEANADHMPVGFHDKLDVPFTNTEFQLIKAILFIFSPMDILISLAAKVVKNLWPKNSNNFF